MRLCKQCDTPLTKRAHESKKRFEKKKFCSAKCSRIYMKEHKQGWWSPENKEFMPINEDQEEAEYGKI